MDTEQIKFQLTSSSRKQENYNIDLFKYEKKLTPVSHVLPHGRNHYLVRKQRKKWNK